MPSSAKDSIYCFVRMDKSSSADISMSLGSNMKKQMKTIILVLNQLVRLVILVEHQMNELFVCSFVRLFVVVVVVVAVYK